MGIIVGVTGNSGSGKSYLTRKGSNGNFVIDADRIGHLCLKEQTCKQAILNSFGDDLLVDGEIDRKKLGAIVFNDADCLRKLNVIMNGRIIKEIELLIAQFSDVSELIIIDAPTLFSSGANFLCDVTILVTATEEEKVKRIMQRDSITSEQALARLDKQTRDVDLEEKVDYIINNTSTEQGLEDFIKIIEKLTK